MVEGEAARGGGNGWGVWPATPSPLYIGGQVGWGGPLDPQTHLGPAAQGGGGNLAPQVDPP